MGGGDRAAGGERWGDGEDAGAPLPVAEPTDTFAPDPALALLTKSHTAPKLVVDHAAPARGSAPLMMPVGAWDAAAARQACADAVVPTLSAAQRQRIAPLWAQLVAAMGE